MILTNYFYSITIVSVRFVGGVIMNNFYGKRFLSALMGALSVLSSPVASARDDKLGKGNLKGKVGSSAGRDKNNGKLGKLKLNRKVKGKGNLKGKVGSSAGRDKNNGKLGKLKLNRKVKGIDGLKKVLKETGGKVVRVSPDGKGGFVAFVKTPTGVVTLAVVGVSLIAIITFLAVLYSQKSNKGSEEIIVDIKDDRKNKDLISSTNDVRYERKSESLTNGKHLDINKNNTIENVEIKNGVVNNLDINLNDKRKFKVENASGELLEKLFEKDQGKYGLFVGRLFEGFFNDKSGVLRKKFDSNSCVGNLDKFLEVVFRGAEFGDLGTQWRVEGVTDFFSWRRDLGMADDFSDKSCGIGCIWLVNVLNYLYGNSFVEIGTGMQASWGDKISAVLFGFWCSVKFNLGFDGEMSRVEEVLKSEYLGNLREVFKTISEYVKERLEAAGRDYNGRKKS